MIEERFSLCSFIFSFTSVLESTSSSGLEYQQMAVALSRTFSTHYMLPQMSDACSYSMEEGVKSSLAMTLPKSKVLEKMVAAAPKRLP